MVVVIEEEYSYGKFCTTITHYQTTQNQFRPKLIQNRVSSNLGSGRDGENIIHVSFISLGKLTILAAQSCDPTYLTQTMAYRALNYPSYYVAYDLASLNAIISFMHVLRAHEHK